LFTYSRCTMCSSICTLMSFSVSLLSPVHITVVRALVDYRTSVCRVYSLWTSLHDTLVSPYSFHWHAHTHLSICRYDTEIVPNQLGPVVSCVRLPSGIEPANFRFVAQHLNHCATAAPLKRRLIDIKYMKTVRQEGQPNTGYGFKAAGFMTISSAVIHTSTITHTHIFRSRLLYVDCKHQTLWQRKYEGLRLRWLPPPSACDIRCTPRTSKTESPRRLMALQGHAHVNIVT
jgi:hypothetical protein